FCSFFFQAEDGIRDFHVTGVQTCALPIYRGAAGRGLAPTKDATLSHTALTPFVYTVSTTKRTGFMARSLTLSQTRPMKFFADSNALPTSSTPFFMFSNTGLIPEFQTVEITVLIALNAGEMMLRQIHKITGASTFSM